MPKLGFKVITIKESVYDRAAKYHRAQKKAGEIYSISFSRVVTELLSEALESKGF